jgi:2-polyprenyl-6-methoxyphenol hydroxylase-like FAD-dependent oxidoreductase
MSQQQAAIDVPVLVVGAGPTGLMMASQLARARDPLPRH